MQSIISKKIKYIENNIFLDEYIFIRRGWRKWWRILTNIIKNYIYIYIIIKNWKI